MFLKKVKETIQEFGLLELGEKILIAYSGGPDSTALMLALLDLQPEWELELELGHFNHQLRRSADDDEQFVRRVAGEFSLPLSVGAEDVRRVAVEQGMNIEEAGRSLRYRFLQETARTTGCNKIATGHTLNDQAETFFMRLIRGSGLKGLSGIFPVIDGLIIRPLLGVERQDVESFLQSRNAPFVVDRTNSDRRFLRNKVRHDLVPFFEAGFDPKIVSRIGKITSILREDEAVLGELASEEAKKVICEKDGRLCLNWAALASLPLGMARRVVREYILALKGDLRRISYEDVENVLIMEAGKEIQLKKDLLLRRERNLIFCLTGDVEKTEFEFLWSGDCPLDIAPLNLHLKGQNQKTGPDSLIYDDRLRVFLDRKKLRFPLTVRTRREGDRYHPLGAPGRQKLKEILRAKSIPTPNRDRLPVVLSAGEIVWVTGLPVSEKYKVNPQTEDVFMISVESGLFESGL